VRCRFCKRKLKDAVSIRLGAGKGCLRKFKGYRQARKIEARGQLTLFSRRPWSYTKALTK